MESTWFWNSCTRPGGAFDERLHHASGCQATDGNGKTVLRTWPSMSSSRIQAQRWRLQPLIKKSWTLDPYGGRTIHTGITVFRNALLAAPSRREDPLNIETRSGETRKLSKHHSGAKDYYSKCSLMSKKYRDKLVVCYNCGMPGHKHHRLPIESEQSCHLE